MHKIRSSLNQHERPHTSMSYKYLRESNQTSFIPFAKERDSMGRLIKPSISQHFMHHQSFKLQQIQTQERQSSPNVKSSKMQDKMSKYFKRTGLSISTELNKNKIIKKCLINIPLDEQTASQHMKKIDNQKNNEKQQLKMKQMRFTLDQWNKNNQAEKKCGIRRMKSTLIPRSNSCMSQIKPSRKSQDIGLNHRASMAGIKKQVLNLQRFQQLNMYHKRQQLEVKMQTTFEEGHLKFIDKMMKSKKLAHDLKNNLDLIDHYC